MTAATAASAIPATSVEPRDRLGVTLPLRDLGVGGPRVTLLGLGGYHIGWTTEILASATLEAALECGIRFFDTAESYGPMISEERYGRLLSPYRDLLFLTSKTTALDATTAQSHLEGTLRRLKCDRIDLWHLHALTGPGDIDRRLAQGVLDYALRAREEGKIRHIGITGHTDPKALLHLMDHPAAGRNVLTACMFPINPVDASCAEGFVERVLPQALHLGLGVLAMKTLADGHFFAAKDTTQGRVWSTEDPVVPNVLSLSECFRYALSLPISALVVGAEKPEYLLDKVALARFFTPMNKNARAEIIAKAARFALPGNVEYYKQKPI